MGSAQFYPIVAKGLWMVRRNSTRNEPYSNREHDAPGNENSKEAMYKRIGDSIAAARMDAAAGKAGQTPAKSERGQNVLYHNEETEGPGGLAGIFQQKNIQ